MKTLDRGWLPRSLPRSKPFLHLIWRQVLEDTGTGYLFGNALSLADIGLLEVLLYCFDYFGDGILEELKPLKVLSFSYYLPFVFSIVYHMTNFDFACLFWKFKWQCFSTARIWRMTRSSVFTGVCPSTLAGVDGPHFRSGQGDRYPMLIPFPGLDSGGVLPSQISMGRGGYPHLRSGWGYTGVPPAQDWMGVPPTPSGVDGVPPLSRTGWVCLLRSRRRTFFLQKFVKLKCVSSPITNAKFPS